MAIHSLQAAQTLIQNDSWQYATHQCRKDVQRLGLTRDVVAAMILSLTENDHRKEFGLCDTELGEIAADDYLLWFDDAQMTRTRRNMGDCFYIKFGIHVDDNGTSCLIVSFHLDGRP